VASVLFFFLLSVVSLGPRGEPATGSAGAQALTTDTTHAAADTTAAAVDTAALADVRSTTPSGPDVSVSGEGIHVSPTGLAPLDSALQRRVRRLNQLPAGEAFRRLLAELFAAIPTSMFVLLPLFALILKLLYLRTGRFYAEHFVFSLHLHAFLFALSITAIVSILLA
jgi:hypothetical protein